MKQSSHYTLEKHVAPEHYKHLFDIPIYRRCKKGAGFYKYHITSIRGLPFDKNDEKVIVILQVKANHWKTNRKIYVEAGYNAGEITIDDDSYYTNLVDYFKENLPGSCDMKQYNFERQQILDKYPEYFL